MVKERFPVTPAVRMLRASKVDFEPHLYDYVERGGAACGAASLGVPEHCVIKTLVFEDEKRRGMVVLMHGDLEVSTQRLARHIGCKSISPCPPERAQANSGYQVGGTSPFGLRRPLPVYIEETILELDRIYINGGKRGFLVSMDPRAAVQLLDAKPVRVGVSK